MSLPASVNTGLTSIGDETPFFLISVPPLQDIMPVHDLARSSCKCVSVCNEICWHTVDYILLNMLMSCITLSMMVGVGGTTKILSVPQDIVIFAENPILHFLLCIKNHVVMLIFGWFSQWNTVQMKGILFIQYWNLKYFYILEIGMQTLP